MKSLDGVNKKNDVNNTASEAPEKNVKTESEKIDFSKVSNEHAVCPCEVTTPHIFMSGNYIKGIR